jgi:hypothetical protein
MTKMSVHSAVPGRDNKVVQLNAALLPIALFGILLLCCKRATMSACGVEHMLLDVLFLGLLFIGLQR